MIWDYFIEFAIAAVVLWMAGAWCAWKERRRRAIVATCLGLLIFLAYIIILWGELKRPPLRTMGETRLWYSFFLPLAGIIVYSRWKYKWILTFTTILSVVFICINLFKPEIHSKSLMPALQSPWFAPHVIVYMLAYAMMGAAFVMAIYMMFFNKDRTTGHWGKEMSIIDDMVAVSYAFLTLGMLMGALWAKDAWGHYWSWDPKETWAAITWLACLVYVHYRYYNRYKTRPALVMVIIIFCLLQMCWWGVNYLPSAQGASVHTYSIQN